MEINQPAAKFQDMSIAPMHTAEHILNQTMVRMFGCPRSRNAHVEKKKSKCDYILEAEPSAEEVGLIEAKVNEIIAAGLDVTAEFVSREEAAEIVDLSKLPEDASQTLRIVRIGDYDACACIGAHVGNKRTWHNRHSDACEAAQGAKEACVRSLLLTHCPAAKQQEAVEAAQALLDIPVGYAQPYRVYEF